MFRPEDVIVNDLSKKPIWELSCYGLNTSWETGRNILNSDVSPEELRLEAYAQNAMIGNINAYLETLARTRAERSILIKQILDNPSAGVQVARTPLVSLVAGQSQSLSLSSDQLTQPLQPVQQASLQVPQAINQVPIHVQVPVQPVEAPVQPVQQPRSAFQFGQIPDLPPS